MFNLKINIMKTLFERLKPEYLEMLYKGLKSYPSLTEEIIEDLKSNTSVEKLTYKTAEIFARMIMFFNKTELSKIDYLYGIFETFKTQENVSN